MKTKIFFILLYCFLSFNLYAQSTINANFDFNDELKGWIVINSENKYRLQPISMMDKCILSICSNDSTKENGDLKLAKSIDLFGSQGKLKIILKLNSKIDKHLQLFFQKSITAKSQFPIFKTYDGDSFTYEVTFDIDMSYQCFLGIIYSGEENFVINSVKVFVNDVELHNIQKEEFARNLDKEFDNNSGIQIDNVSPKDIDKLSLLGRVWCFLKYYHPINSKTDINWDYELFRVMPKIINCNDKKDVEETIYQWIDSYGDLRNSYIDKTIDHKFFMYSDTTLFISNKIKSKLLRLKLRNIFISKQQKFNQYVFFSETPKFDFENIYKQFNLPDCGFRLLALYRYWGAIEYLYPYRYSIGKDWSCVLDEMIPYFINANSIDEYKCSIMRLSATINDSHAMFNMISDENKLWGKFRIPASIEYVENKPIIKYFFTQHKYNLEVGDIIKKIDGVKIAKLMRYYYPYFSASNHSGKLKNIGNNLGRTNDSIVSLIIERNKKRLEIRVPIFINSQYEKRSILSKVIDSVLYIYSEDSLSNIMNYMNDINLYNGIIVDMRCYGDVDSIINILAGKEERLFVELSQMDEIIIGSSKKTLKQAVKGIGREWYSKPLVIIVDETTQSAAEFQTMKLQVFPKAYTIGSISAGADGNVTKIPLPGGLYTKFTGLGVYYPDGGETQRVGVRIDEIVKPTIKGIREGRDEVLERAIEIVNSKTAK